MNYNKKTVRDFDPHGKKVLLRCDFNVPQNKETGEITSDKRIVAALPTIKYLLENGAAVIACSHLGKPKGEWKESLTLAPVAKRLSELLGMEVIFAKDIIGEDAKAKAAALQPGQLLLLEKADTIIVGGGMAYTFKMAQGHTIGKSLLEADRVEYAKEMMDKAAAKGVKLLLPVDSICAAEFSKDAAPVEAGEDIPEDLMGMDIGPKTVELYCEAVKGAGTIVWNGPMGVFEFPAFANGTWKMAEAVANSGAVTIIGGGDSASAVEKSGQADKITHISTGGGASLEFLEGLELPGVACLLDK